jgi:D-amino-acid oxidase
MEPRKACVIGAGISGLTTADCLQEDGWLVTVIASEFTPHTPATDNSGGWIFPFHVDVDAPWNLSTLMEDTALRLTEMTNTAESGVTLASGVVAFDVPTATPLWAKSFKHFRRASSEEFLAGHGYVDGFSFSTLLVDTRRFMEFLQRKLFSSGRVAFLPGTIRALDDEALRNADVIVNCAGVGAYHLVHDLSVYPIRGQLIIASKPELPRYEQPSFFLADTSEFGFVHVFNYADHVKIGGTLENGIWSRRPDPSTSQALINNIANLFPEFGSIEIHDHIVGLRPGRSSLRLESQFLPSDQLLISNYGHGGSGVTLSYGCAKSVVQLAKQHLSITVDNIYSSYHGAVRIG